VAVQDSNLTETIYLASTGKHIFLPALLDF